MRMDFLKMKSFLKKILHFLKKNTAYLNSERPKEISLKSRCIAGQNADSCTRLQGIFLF